MTIQELEAEMRRTLRNAAPIGSGQTHLTTSATGRQVKEWADTLTALAGAEQQEQERLKAELAKATIALDEVVAPDDEKPLDQRIRDEFADFQMLVDHCSQAYYHMTNGRISKPNTLPRAVFSEADDIFTEMVQEETKDLREQLEAAEAALAQVYERTAADGDMADRAVHDFVAAHLPAPSTPHEEE